MKKIFGLFLVLSIIIAAIIYKYQFPYLYLPIPKYWSVSDKGFPEIKELNDSRYYYWDKLDAKGYNKKEIRYSAFHQAYRNSVKGSDLEISALISLTGMVQDLNNKIYLQKKILEKYLYFKNHCYNNNCNFGHDIATVTHGYSRSLVKKGDLTGAFHVLRKTYEARKNELQPWVRFVLLEEIYIVLNKKPLIQNDKDYFSSVIKDMDLVYLDTRLTNRYIRLVAWNKKLQTKYLTGTE